MAKSYVAYNGTGALQNLSVTFPYLDQDHVFVLVDDVEVDFSWVNETTVQVTTTVGTANVIVKRVTPSTPLVTFTNSSGISAEDLNDGISQSRYVAEEIEDAYQGEVLVNDSVVTANIQDGAVTAVKIAADAVTTSKILNSNVTTAKIADLNVTEGKLAASAVATAKIADAAVTTAKIADLNVTEGKLAASAVATAKIADAAVTQAKLLYPAGYTGYIRLQDQRSSGTDGGASVATTWTKRVVNTEVVDTGNHASVASDVITLLAGTYRILARAVLNQSGVSKLRLRNTSDNTTAVIGMSYLNTTASDVSCTVLLEGRFTIASTKNFELQYYAGTSKTVNGVGDAAGSGETEIYTDIELIRE